MRSAKFFRNSGTVCIEVTPFRMKNNISLFEGLIAHGARVLSDLEIDEAITILLADKKMMSKQRNFPPIFNKMLLDLIKVREERYETTLYYGEKESYDTHYRLSLYGLEDMIKQHFNLGRVHIDSVVGGVNDTRKWIDLKSDNRVLFVDYIGGDKEDE